MTTTPPPAPEGEPARDLVACYCFPPYTDTAGIVAAKRVREMGRPVDVIQNSMAPLRAVDPDLAHLAEDLVVRRHEVLSRPRFSAWSSIVAYTERGLQQALAWDRSGPGYERVYSRAHFAASHYLAARVALLRPGLRWAAEFSDPLSHDVTGAVRHSPVEEDALLARLGEGIAAAGFTPPTSGNAYEWAETAAYALAEELIFTNEHQRDIMIEAIAEERLAERVHDKAVIAPHPTLPPEFYTLKDPDYPLDPTRRHIGYFGNFYATRGVGTVLEALALLPGHLRDRLCLHLFVRDSEPVDEQVALLGLEGVVTTGPFVDFLDFLAITRRMDVLLVNDAATTGTLSVNPFLPSKWSDYRGSGSAVWGMVEPGSSLDRQPLDLRSPIEHTSAAVQVLAQIAEEGPTSGLSRAAAQT